MRARAGFSLVEVIMAAALIGLILVALCTSLPLAFGCLRRSEETTVAQNLAAQYLAWWSVRDYPAIYSLSSHTVNYTDPLPGPVPTPPDPQANGSLTSADSRGPYQTRVVFTPTSDKNLMQIDVYVDSSNAHVHVSNQVFNAANPW